MKSITSIIILLLIAIASPVFSQSDVPSFEMLDKSRDGLIDRDEAQADERVAAGFAEADQNFDGYLSSAEFAAIWN